MTTARVKTWSAEVLGYADLNAEFDNLVDDINTIEDSIPTITSAAETVLDDLSTSAMRTTLGVGYGTSATTVCVGNDSRLSDTRTPTAGSVVVASMAANSVGLAPLLTSSANTSTTELTAQSIVMTGGQYCFHPTFKTSATGTAYNHTSSTTSTTYVALLGIAASSGQTAYAEWQYFAASPPYDLGDGEVNGFIYLKFDIVTGQIVSTSIAEDPPWYGNTPRFADKLKGMDKIPHPFRTLKKNHKVFMVDPMSDLVRELILMQGEGADVPELFYNGKIQLIKPVKRSMPPGIVAYKCEWK